MRVGPRLVPAGARAEPAGLPGVDVLVTAV